MSLQEQMLEICAAAKLAGAKLACISGSTKDKALIALAAKLVERKDEIFKANAKDLQAAEEGGMDSARLDRLRITDAVIESMSTACKDVAAQSDPVGEIEGMTKRPNGLLIGRMRIPLGVILMIYESRPNVTIDSAILCLKAGNSIILRGGSEAIHSNLALAKILREALVENGLPESAAQVVPVTDREAVAILLKQEDSIDVAIPRGGEGLIRAVTEQAHMPVLKHYKGVCHAYVDEQADLPQALEIVYNGKVQRPGVCNALECLLVHRSVAEEFLPMVAEKLGKAGVTFKACPQSLPLLGSTAEPATDHDWGYEFHSLVLAVKVVDSMDEALEHIRKCGSNHTELICTRDHARAMRFLREADASLVLVNASSRFNDGGEVGLGAEIGISTSKLHAYGPMGVRELTSTKFVAFGDGQVRG
ncbi:MAG: glutamate-5-semialdehyde dehydrogenase [Desulfovibrio sp.]|uniref:glutamate-5-semialdehyde dehydrogenase n=1 Tax=Desulfovibrio sp. 7SRBS1 TaxID=3378064 RepID=UPI003B3C7131